jgi:ribulose-5-phosphate 4-epimerase/fuculose-1-phosphate aldolase
MTDQEWKIRCDLAACYRIADMLRWSDGIFTHFSARIPGEEDCYLINSYGLLFDEITAENLVKVNLKKEKLSAGRINDVAIRFHNSVHENLPNVNCIIHTHTSTGVAVSAERSGLLPISQHAITVYNQVGYHDYQGVFFWDKEQHEIIDKLKENDILILKNHGLVATSSNIASCFNRMYMLEEACKIQANTKDPILLKESITAKSLEKSLEDLTNSKSTVLMWNAMLRKLDRLGIKYKND